MTDKSGCQKWPNDIIHALMTILNIGIPTRTVFFLVRRKNTRMPILYTRYLHSVVVYKASHRKFNTAMAPQSQCLLCCIGYGGDDDGMGTTSLSSETLGGVICFVVCVLGQ